MPKELTKIELKELVLLEYFPSKNCHDFIDAGGSDKDIITFLFSSNNEIDFEDLDTPGWTHSGVMSVINGGAEKKIDFRRTNRSIKVTLDPKDDLTDF